MCASDSVDSASSCTKETNSSQSKGVVCEYQLGMAAWPCQADRDFADRMHLTVNVDKHKVMVFIGNSQAAAPTRGGKHATLPIVREVP